MFTGQTPQPAGYPGVGGGQTGGVMPSGGMQQYPPPGMTSSMNAPGVPQQQQQVSAGAGLCRRECVFLLHGVVFNPVAGWHMLMPTGCGMVLLKQLHFQLMICSCGRVAGCFGQQFMSSFPLTMHRMLCHVLFHRFR